MQVCGVLRQLSRVHALAGDLGRAALSLDQCLQAEILLYGTSSRRAQASRLRLQEMMQLSPCFVKHHSLVTAESGGLGVQF